jgi:hypothetical protein
MYFLRVKTSTFSLLVPLSSYLQNIRKFGSIAMLNKLRNPARSFFVHKLLLKRILLVSYSLDQKLFEATLSFLLIEAIVWFVKKQLRTNAHSNYFV